MAILFVLGMGSVAALFGSRGYGQASANGYQIQSETVGDPKTGLTWQRLPVEAKVPLDSAHQYCADLALAGRDDWRLPSMQEFQTIVDEQRSDPAIDPAAFPNTPPEAFWSGTRWSDTPELAWHVDFDRGAAAYDKATMMYRVRCVRWGP